MAFDPHNLKQMGQNFFSDEETIIWRSLGDFPKLKQLIIYEARSRIIIF